MVQYVVTGACAHATIDGPHGRRRQLHFKGTVLPPDVPDGEIEHLLSVGLIKPVGGLPAPSAAPAPVEPSVTDEPAGDGPGDGEPGGEDTGEPTGETADKPEADSDGAQPEVDPEVESKRAEARAKLPADGSKPDGRMGQPVWVEYLVNNGYDYAALAKEDKKALVDLAGSLT